jgi:hypothetical protein
MRLVTMSMEITEALRGERLPAYLGVEESVAVVGGLEATERLHMSPAG